MFPNRYRLEFMMPRSPSAAVAISNAEVSNVSEDVAYAVGCLCGQACCSVCFSQTDVWLGMTNGQARQVTAQAVRIVEPDRTRPAADDILVVWTGTEEVWHRGSLLRACEGKSIKNAFYNGNELYLYWEGLHGALCFRPARIVDTGETLLYWHLTG